ncbi:hypothetical protein OBBRIDRAFT_62853 [Obba rivulosa]|uniref:Uncharacterized protein n=1 Tax=Obba rivulosa TaxID=1052685 RepID=A0A8E2AV19_9APHY|nr:hypothetical protein OBBRIDRAFT_62853 [Obba rivulosa]
MPPADPQSEQRQASAEYTENLRSNSRDPTKDLPLRRSGSSTLANFKVQLSAYHTSIVNSEKHFCVYEHSVQQLIEVCDSYARRWLSDSAYIAEIHTSGGNWEGSSYWCKQLSLCIEEDATLDPVPALIKSENLKESLRRLWADCPADMRKSHHFGKPMPSVLPSYSETFECLREVLSSSASCVRLMSMDDNDVKSFVELLDKESILSTWAHV